MSVGGWEPYEADWWPEHAGATVKPWPKGAAAFDLRWHAARNEGDVGHGRPHWMERWGWTDWAVKQLLRAEATWRDPAKARRQPTASRPPADRQRTASAPPAAAGLGADNGEETASAPPADRQPTASAPPADRHARVGSPSPSPSPEDTVGAASPPPVSDRTREQREAFERLAGLWKERHPGGPPLTRTKGLGVPLYARLVEHGEVRVRQVLDWAEGSSHKRATFLREQGLSLKTLTRPANFAEYLGFSEAPAPRKQFERAPRPELAAPSVRPSTPEAHPDAVTVWGAVLEQLEGHMRRDDIDTWLRRGTPVGLTGTELHVWWWPDLLEFVVPLLDDVRDALGEGSGGRRLVVNGERPPLRLVEAR